MCCVRTAAEHKSVYVTNHEVLKYVHPAGTPLISLLPPGSLNVMRFVSWLICSELETVRVWLNSIVLGTARVLVGGMLVESSSKGLRVE